MAMNREKVYKKAIFSETAIKNKIINRPDFEQCENIEQFYKNVVSKLEKMFFNKFIINSWFRNPELNKLIGGSSHSKHMQGLAVDFYIENDDIEKVFKNIADNGNIIFNKMIVYPDKNFIHIGWDYELNKINARLLYKKMKGENYQRIK